MIQTIHEVEDRFDGYARALGPCTVMFLTAGSTTSNPQFIVRLYVSGQVRTVDQNDILLYGNPGFNEPLVPDIPYDWLTAEDRKQRDEKNINSTSSDYLFGNDTFTDGDPS